MPDYGDVFGQRTDQPAAGLYPLTLVSVKKMTSKKDGSEFRLWSFATEDGQTFTGTTSLAMTSSSKAWRWATVLLGADPKAGTKLTDLVGRECLGDIELNSNGYAHVSDIQRLPTVDDKLVKDEPVGF